MGGGREIFELREFFYRYQIPCMNFFFPLIIPLREYFFCTLPSPRPKFSNDPPPTRAICMMALFYYYDQNPSGFSFLVQIIAFVI